MRLRQGSRVPTTRKDVSGTEVSRFARVFAGLVVVLVIGLIAPAQAANPEWRAIAIGPPGLWALDLNDEGVIVGYVRSGSEQDAVMWRDGTTTPLETPPNAVRGVATAINSLGQIVGTLDLQLEAGVRQQAVLWEPNGDYTLLGFLGNGSFSSAHDINDLGQIVGVASPAGGTYTAFLWEGNGLEALPIPEAPPCPPGGCGFLQTTSFADGINNRGEIVGTLNYPFQPTKAMLWTSDGTPTFLTPLSPGRRAAATEINDAGEIVGNGSLETTGSAPHAVVWVDQDPADLGSLGGFGAAAFAISSDGLIAGFLSDTAGLAHPYLWQDLVGTELPLLAGDVQGVASGVNAKGQIIGSSTSPTGISRAVMWTTQVDTSPPVITVPADMTVNATSPSGAIVNFTATATDENPSNPTVTCKPFSGSAFSIGLTTVSCSASDAEGNTATASFDITVEGAAGQLADLHEAVRDVGSGSSLADKIAAAQTTYTTGDLPRTCEILGAFTNQVKAQTGKSIPPGTADSLLAEVTRVQVVLGC